MEGGGQQSRRVSVVIEPDFLERQARTSPLNALAEFIWNAVDADATLVEVEFVPSDLGGLDRIIIRDNGTGIPHSEVEDKFSHLGGSWKRLRGKSLKEGRELHGREGRGRFKAVALGRVAEWHVTYDAGPGGLRDYSIAILSDNLREVEIGEDRLSKAQRTGVEVVISELHHDFRSLQSDDAVQDLTEMFALYLLNYRVVVIAIQGLKLDPKSAIAGSAAVNLSDVEDFQGKKHPARLEIVEWRRRTKRALYLCTWAGFPLSQLETRFHVGDHHFSAYLKSDYVQQLHDANLLQVAEMDAHLVAATDEAKGKIKEHFRALQAEAARSVVDTWKAENSYPYQRPPQTVLEEVERQVFDIVAVTASQYVPDFTEASQKNRAFQLRMLRQAVERSPEDLQLILKEVLDLPTRKQEDLARLLQETSLSSIIGAAKVVADRLKFLVSLDAIIHDEDISEHVRERTQLHRIVADNTWLFGEEFNLVVNDQGLTQCLRKHAKDLGKDIVINRPVKHPTKQRGIIDLMFSRTRRLYRPTDLEHLVVELKAPDVKIGRDEINQIEEYAQAIVQDSRFDVNDTSWSFWVLSRDIDEKALEFKQQEGQPAGVILRKKNVTIWVRKWGQIIEENKARMQFFQEQLAHQVDKGAALKHLRARYENLLSGTVANDAISDAIEADEDEAEDSERGLEDQEEGTEE